MKGLQALVLFKMAEAHKKQLVSCVLKLSFFFCSSFWYQLQKTSPLQASAAICRSQMAICRQHLPTRHLRTAPTCRGRMWEHGPHVRTPLKFPWMAVHHTRVTVKSQWLPCIRAKIHGNEAVSTTWHPFMPTSLGLIQRQTYMWAGVGRPMNFFIEIRSTVMVS